MFIFVVKPLGTCRGWGSSRSVALLSAPPEAQCAAPGGPHPVAPNGAGADGGEGTGYAVSGGHSGRVLGNERPWRAEESSMPSAATFINRKHRLFQRARKRKSFWC
ncbi:unnamed protein product [Pleuronectes platessa]|uniref:Uncharacterized protein n=1 Tax=Pleuronectes platessa TaxID=8262 RepID=A0A9N7V8H8_PLEPL|nr:unnamed protein product [Pleuronectes platessa]